MRLPWHRFLKYLLLTKHTDKEIVDLLRQSDGSEVGTAYLTSIRGELYSSADKELETFLKSDDLILVKLHRKDIPDGWILQMDMEEAHNATEDFRFAYECFSDHRKRNYLNIYILCMDVDIDQIIEMYRQRFREDILPDQILIYLQYFADFESMNPNDWDRFIRRLENCQRVIYELAPCRKLPYIQWRMGDSVKLSPETVNNTLMADFYMLTRDEYDMNTRRDGWADRAAKFAGLAMSAGDRVEKHRDPIVNSNKLIMLFEENEEKIAPHTTIDQGDDPEDPNDSAGKEPNDSDDTQ